MNFKEIDWPILQGAIIIFSISLVTSILMIGGSWYFKKEMKAEYARSQSQFQSISNQYLAVDEEEKLIKKYYSQFATLFNEGILGQEKRLDWIETLRATSEGIKLPGLRYKINSQEIYTPEFPVNLGNYLIYKSDMELNLELLHEGDLFSVLQDLNKKAPGIYSVSRCKFVRNSKKIEEDPNKANINTDCNLQWYSIKNSEGNNLKLL